MDKRKAESSIDNDQSKKSKSSYVVSDSFLKILLETKLSHLTNAPDGGVHVFVAYKGQLARDVFRGLIEHRFLSCPVLSKKSDVYYGFLDLVDFVNYFVAELADKDLHTQSNDAWELLQKEDSFQNLVVKKLMSEPLSYRNPFRALAREYSLYTAMETLALEKNLHRLAILNENRALVNLVTQSQIVAFIAKHLESVGSIKDKPISEIPSVFRDVIKIKKSEPAIEAFKQISTHNITGVAVVDDHGKLIGNISARDLKGISLDGKWWSRFFLTGGEYLEVVANMLQDKPENVIFVLPSHSLAEVILKISTKKIHRVYVVESEASMRPIGVVGLKEILCQFLP